MALERPHGREIGACEVHNHQTLRIGWRMKTNQNPTNKQNKQTKQPITTRPTKWTKKQLASLCSLVDSLWHRRAPQGEGSSTLVILHDVLVSLMFAFLYLQWSYYFFGAMGKIVFLPYKKVIFFHIVFFFFFPLMHRQVALADLVIINKTDLVSEEELNKVRTSVRYEIFVITATLYWFKVLI